MPLTWRNALINSFLLAVRYDDDNKDLKEYSTLEFDTSVYNVRLRQNTDT